MKLCDNEHPEIVFSGEGCPLCETRSANESIYKENARLQEEIDKLEGEVAQLEFEKEENHL